MRHRLTRPGLIGVAAPAVAGCGSSAIHSTDGKAPATGASSTAAQVSAARGTSGTSSLSPSKRIVIPAVFTHRKGRGVSAFIVLTVEGRPYLFRVGTGATRTTVDYTFAKAVALPARGAPTSETSVCRKVLAQPVEISDWRLGAATLPATRIISTKVAGAGSTTHGAFAGSLGSDVLSRFGTLPLDPAGGRLIVGGRAPVGAKTIPMRVGHAPDGELGLSLTRHDPRAAGRLGDRHRRGHIDD